ncbi:MAG: GDSL-type esterase/lipase family protein [Cyanobacteria bacterium J06598_1]
MTATFPQASPSKKPQRLSERVITHPKKVVAIGDSLVYGYGDGEGGGWVERLRREWLTPEKSGPILYSLGVRGDGVVQVAKRLEREFCDRGELRHRTPEVLVLSFGVNDSARAGRAEGRPVTDLKTFELATEQLLKQACTLCSVYFVGMVPVNEAAMPFANILHFSRTQQHQYRDVTRRLCEENQIPYLDLLAQWEQEDDDWVCDRLCADGIHPNVLGYRTILEAVQSWQPLMSALQ